MPGFSQWQALPLEPGIALRTLMPSTSPGVRVEKNKVAHCVTAIHFHTEDVQSETQFKESI